MEEEKKMPKETPSVESAPASDAAPEKAPAEPQKQSFVDKKIPSWAFPLVVAAAFALFYLVSKFIKG